jgi:hypothetical protein
MGNVKNIFYVYINIATLSGPRAKELAERNRTFSQFTFGVWSIMFILPEKVIIQNNSV